MHGVVLIICGWFVRSVRCGRRGKQVTEVDDDAGEPRDTFDTYNADNTSGGA
jgi:hypothetical protein